jgi:superfamily II DNA or RNA helicase/HKD family nuclease
MNVSGRGDDAPAPPPWPHREPLIHGDDDPLLPHLEACFPRARRVCIAVAFVLDQGVDLIRPFLVDLLAAGGELRLLTGDYFDCTEPRGLERLLDLQAEMGGAERQSRIELRMFETRGGGAPSQAFHPKAYIFHHDGEGIAFVGSSNLSRTALGNGVEWNYRIIASSDAAGFGSVTRAFDDLFGHARTVPLTAEWIRAYRLRRAVQRQMPVEVASEELAPPEAHAIQREALAALRQTRERGNRAGLVVLATGLGKTWLSAFDSVAFARETKTDLASQRLLFVAHREEILDQALATYRRIRPGSVMGKFTGLAKDGDATVLFASIQTLSKPQHLQRFSTEHFAYIVVDEFHHAAADTYRRLLEHFRPGFLLGLTATPERTDGGDLLALCGHNLVFRCDLGEGVKAKLLSAFRYFGVHDDVDYSGVPWSRQSGRFDELELTRALATERRAGNALQQWQQHGGDRTLGFCCSQAHADYMAEYYRQRGVRAVAVHSGVTSAPRANSLRELEAGTLQVLFCVDMFNEGVDVPAIDTVLMLRPTESRIVWLQQFGRGLRRVADKTLRVIDYIGNHRVFLTKVQALLSSVLGLGESHHELREFVLALKRSEAELPAGCEITYDLQVIDVLSALLRPTTSEELLREAYEEFRFQHGRRPTAREMFMSGGLQRETLRRGFGSWFGLVEQMGDLAGPERLVMQRHAAFLSKIEQPDMKRSYMMLVLEAMLEEGALPGVIRTDVLAARLERIAERSPRLRAELAATMEGSSGTVAAMLKSNPLRAWAGTKRGEGSDFFMLEGDRFGTRFGVEGAVAGAVEDRETLPVLTRELVEWRLAEYLSRAWSDVSEVLPDGPKALRVGASYMREEIPPLLGSAFTRTVWQQGIVAVPSGLVLLVTLDKQGKVENQKYEDRFESPSQFQWQSQNQTTRDGKHGRLIHGHAAMGKQIHLFVRKRGKRANSTAAPFFYCGELVFERWEGERPITVWWRLKVPLQGELWGMLGTGAVGM